MNTLLRALKRNAVELPMSVREGLLPGRPDGSPHPGSEEAEAGRRMRRGFLHHLHPLRVTERALDPTVTLGLGIATLTLAVLLVMTGVLLMVYYVPTTAEAYGSMQDLQYAISLGGFIRALHRWTAHGMVATVALHVVRVLAMGAHRGRALNWLFGLVLLAVTLGLAFTGYLLPWDQLSYWAVNVAASMLDHVPWIGLWLKRLALGGDAVGQPTLTRFYTLHVALLPGLLLVAAALHLWRVRKDGGLAGPGAQTTVPAWPHLVQREVALALAVTAAFCAASLIFAAPLGAPPDLHTPSNPEKAPWYFLGAQEMVSYSATMGGFVFPLILLLGLALLPFFDREDEGVGCWLGAPATRNAVLVTLGAAVLAFALLEPLYLHAAPPASALGRDLLNPAAGMLLVSAIAFVLGGASTGSTRAAFLCAFAVLIVAMVGFTAMGLCRGPNWVFYWPWEAWPHGY
ncbi:MAG: cytochrome b N-terminal domain-containing protein [Deltaproteobacteria bacterium]|nr:cytochrome b N-terminal domain-containing protein [Deltaproteobacteria bacterium]